MCGGCQLSMVSNGFYEFCISPRVTKGWRQKEINSLLSDTTESACIIIIIIIIIIIEIITVYNNRMSVKYSKKPVWYSVRFSTGN